MLTAIIALALLTQTPSSGVGEPPKNASPELVEMYHRLNAEVSVHAPPPASVVASPIRQQVPLDAEIHQRQVPTIQSPVVNDSTRALVAKKRADLARKGQSYQQDMRRIESENARAQAAAAAYRYYNTPDYVNVTRNSDGSFSTYATTPRRIHPVQGLYSGHPHPTLRDRRRPLLLRLRRLHVAVPVV